MAAAKKINMADKCRAFQSGLRSASLFVLKTLPFVSFAKRKISGIFK
jgi:hypothetical protein